MCVGVGPFIGAWESYQWSHPQRNVILLPPATVRTRNIIPSCGSGLKSLHKVLLCDTSITISPVHTLPGMSLLQLQVLHWVRPTLFVSLFTPWSQHSTSLHWERWPARVTLPAVLRLLSQPKYVMSSITGFSPEDNQEQYCNLCCFGDFWKSSD